MKTLRQRALEDFNKLTLDDKLFEVWYSGYIAAIKRFGGK